MGKATVTVGRDCWVDSNRKSKWFPTTGWLRLHASRYRAFIYMASPVPRGADVTSATLRISGAGDALTGQIPLTLRPADRGFGSHVKWSNQPGVVGTAIIVTKTAPNANTWWEFDVTDYLDKVAKGQTKHYGWRFYTSTTKQVRLRSLQSGSRRPTLTVEWATTPTRPSRLTPSGGLISTPSPVLALDYTDEPGDHLTALQVQTLVNGATSWDSGTVLSSVPTMPLVDTAHPVLGLGDTLAWRGRVLDDTNRWSPWSAWTEDSAYDVPPVPVILTPTATASSTPTVSWTSTNQARFQVLVYPADNPTKYVYNSGVIASSDTSHEVKSRKGTPIAVQGATGLAQPTLQDGSSYRVVVRTWDTQDRVATVGAPTYGQAEKTFAVDTNAAMAAPTTLTAKQVGYSPWVELEWSRAVAPDEWEIRIDDVPLQVVEVDDTYVDGTIWRYRTAHAPGLTKLAWTVHAVEDSYRSGPSPEAELATRVEGIWLMDQETGGQVVLRGDESDPDWSAPEIASTFRTASGRSVRRVSALGGLEAEVAGLLYAGGNLTFEEQLATLYWMKSNPDRTYRLAMLDHNLPVTVGEIVPGTSWRTDEGDLVREVKASVWQQGDEPWNLDL